ncbi:MAG TPA: hypothetical protein VLA34_03915, partial [Candidatus Krumholzibacterium sp.]|nr:hypothetical protein [Candidatus Krumholzibacterium sp.]
WRHLVGLRVHASRAGLLEGSRLSKDGLRQEILEESWIRRPGEMIKLPPDDYKSWLLGHVIFSPRDDEPVSLQVGQVRSAVDLSIVKEIPE